MLDVGAGQVPGTGLEMICGLGLLLQGDQVQVCPVCGWVRSWSWVCALCALGGEAAAVGIQEDLGLVCPRCGWAWSWSRVVTGGQGNWAGKVKFFCGGG